MAIYLGVFLITLSGLIFEIGLTRIYSATIWYHFAFVAISVALLGLGPGRPRAASAEAADHADAGQGGACSSLLYGLEHSDRAVDRS